MTTSVSEHLRQAASRLTASSESPRLDAEVLLAHALGTSRAYLYANPDQPLDAAAAARFRQLVVLREESRPVAHLTGEREFWSLNLRVSPDVLVPRPETELLVELGLLRLPERAALSIIDLGCGSGAIAIALATERPACAVTATDQSAAALAVAEANARRLCPGRIEFLVSDWYAALAGRRFDMIVSNPPYIATSEHALTDPELGFEPPDALYSGADGLDAIRTLIAGAPDYLQPGGWLLLEHGFAQAAAVRLLMETAGLEEVSSYADPCGHDRVTAGRRSE